MLRNLILFKIFNETLTKTNFRHYVVVSFLPIDAGIDLTHSLMGYTIAVNTHMKALNGKRISSMRQTETINLSGIGIILHKKRPLM